MHGVTARNHEQSAEHGQARQQVKEERSRYRSHAGIHSRVHRGVHFTSTPTMAVTIRTPSEIGSITFHPTLINWSKR